MTSTSRAQGMVNPFRLVSLMASGAVLYTRLALPDRRGHGPQVVRRTLERMGPTFIKFGQILALQPHIIPGEYCQALWGLLDQCPPEPLPAIRSVLLEELGREPESLFRRFDWEPLSAASFGQVHRAVLMTGERVAVKVQRPSVRKQVSSDIRVFYALAEILDRMGTSGTMKLVSAVEQFERWTRDELDYTVEASYAEELYDEADRDLRRIPLVDWEHTTPRVLTTEFLEGLPLSSYLRMRQTADQKLETWRRRLALDERVLVDNLLRNYLADTMVRGVFQADPHPGNVILMAGNTVGYVDFGIMGRLSPKHQRFIAAYVDAGARGDAEDLVANYMRLVQPGERADPEGFRHAVLYEVRRWLAIVADTSRSPAERNFTRLSLKFMDLLRRHRMVIPPDTLAFYRTVSTIDSISLQLVPDHDMAETGRRFFETHDIPALSPRDYIREQTQQTVKDYLSLSLALPKMLADAIYSIRAGACPEESARQPLWRVLATLILAVISASLLWVGLSPLGWRWWGFRWLAAIAGFLAIVIVASGRPRRGSGY